MKQKINLTETDLHNIVRDSIKRVLTESKNEEITKNVVDAVINDKELLNKALEVFSPKLRICFNGTEKQQLKWRVDDYISENPNIFKPIMNISLRKKIALAIYDEVRGKYPQYFNRY